MNHIILHTVPDTIAVEKSAYFTKMGGNVWFWISIIELIIIVVITSKYKKKVDPNIEDKIKISSYKNVSVDMENVLNSINNSSGLYKRLSAKCHPDLFLDEALNKKATELFQEITKNKRDYKKLLELKEIAQNELNIIV